MSSAPWLVCGMQTDAFCHIFFLASWLGRGWMVRVVPCESGVGPYRGQEKVRPLPVFVACGCNSFASATSPITRTPGPSLSPYSSPPCNSPRKGVSLQHVADLRCNSRSVDAVQGKPRQADLIPWLYPLEMLLVPRSCKAPR